MKNGVLQNWTFLRGFRMVMGIAIIVQAFMAKDTFLGIAGVLFSGMALFNVGCCGTGSCSTTDLKTNNKTKDISYEEVI